MEQLEEAKNKVAVMEAGNVREDRVCWIRTEQNKTKRNRNIKRKYMNDSELAALFGTTQHNDER